MGVSRAFTTVPQSLSLHNDKQQGPAPALWLTEQAAGKGPRGETHRSPRSGVPGLLRHKAVSAVGCAGEGQHQPAELMSKIQPRTCREEGVQPQRIGTKSSAPWAQSGAAALRQPWLRRQRGHRGHRGAAAAAVLPVARCRVILSRAHLARQPTAKLSWAALPGIYGRTVCKRAAPRSAASRGRQRGMPQVMVFRSEVRVTRD